MRRHWNTSKSTAAVQELAGELQQSQRTAGRHLDATAEISLRTQEAHLQQLQKYVWRMQQAHLAKPLALFVRIGFDETPMKLRVATEDDNLGFAQLSKIFAVESSWSLLLEDARDSAQDESSLLILQGQFSHSVRASDSTSAESVAAVLQSCPRPTGGIEELFPVKYRSVESDAAPANLKAERLWQKEHDGWEQTLHYECVAHKCHAIAEKTWHLQKETLSGVTHTLLSLQGGQQMEMVLTALDRVVEQRCTRIISQGLTPAAMQHRKTMLDLFLPPRRHSRQRSVVVAACCVANGDWRKQNVLEHLCGPTCCQSDEEAVLKMKVALRDLIKTLRPNRLCRGNWLEWSKPMAFIGILSMHNLLQVLLTAAFSSRLSSEQELLGVCNSLSP